MSNSPIQLVLDRLRARNLKLKNSNDGWTCQCPAHEDRHPSLSIGIGADGRVLLKCFTGCTAEAVCEALDLKLADLFPPTPGANGRSVDGKALTGTPRSSAPRSKEAGQTFKTAEDAVKDWERRIGRPSDHQYVYQNGGGEPEGVIVRWDKPDGKREHVRPVTRTADGSGWVKLGMPEPCPLYHLPELLEAPQGTPIWVCEGEKATDAARSLGFLATTSPHGCQSAAKADWTPVAGRDVIILPDRDGAGERYAEDVARLTTSAGARSVRIVALSELWPELPEHGDIADLVVHRTADPQALRREIESLAARAEPWVAPPAVQNSIRAPREGDRARIEFKAVPIGDLGPAVPPTWIYPGFIAAGHVTLFTGLWKAGKSTLIGHLLKELGTGGELVPEPKGVKTLVITEEGSTLWSRRREDLGLSNDIHVLCKPFRAKPIYEEWKSLVEWAAAEVVAGGFGLVIFDTLPSFWSVTQENDAADVGAALMPLLAVTDTGAGVLLVHHPRKSGGDEGQGSRGSGALPGFVDIIVEFSRMSPKDPNDAQRVLKTLSRFDESPAEAVLELTATGYRVVGDRAHATQADRIEVIGRLLPTTSPGMSIEELVSAWPTNPEPGKRAIETELKSGVETGRWMREGKGIRNDPFRFHRPP